MNSDKIETGKRPSQVTQDQVAEDFDRLVDSYEDKINAAIAFGGREHDFYINVKRDHILRLAAEGFADIGKLDVLDLGCGIGAYHRGLEDGFRELHGIDVSSRSIAAARSKHPLVRYESYEGGRLPYPDHRFDLVFTVCVMHHVPPADWPEFVEEILRVLKPGGLALVFEHNPYNPATQHIVRSCEIDRDAVLLRPGTLRRLFDKAGYADIRTRGILCVPPIGSLLTALDRLLGRLPLGAQYYLRATKPSG